MKLLRHLFDALLVSAALAVVCVAPVLAAFAAAGIEHDDKLIGRTPFEIMGALAVAVVIVTYPLSIVDRRKAPVDA